MPHDDYEKYYEPRTAKTRKNRSGRLAARDLVRRLAWLQSRLVYWGGPPGQEPETAVPECRPLAQLLNEHLRGRGAGLYAVEITFSQDAGNYLQPALGEVQPVTGNRLADASWVLSQLPQREREVERLVGDADQWREHLYQRLQRFSSVFQATGPRQTETAEGLTIEALCGWLGSSRLRPSRLLPTNVLEAHLNEEREVPSPSQRLAAILLGRRPHARVPQELTIYKNIGQSLRTWTPDTVALVATPDYARRLLAIAQEWPDLDSPEWAAALREYQLLSPRPQATVFLQELPALLAAWRRIEQEPGVRHQRLLELFGRALQDQPHYLDTTRKRQWNRDFDMHCRDLLTADLEAEGIIVPGGVGQQADPFATAALWYLGIELSEAQVDWIRELDPGEPDPSYRLMERLQQILEIRQAPPRPAALALAALVARAAARTTPAECSGALAGWLDHCRQYCLPGAQACGPVRLAAMVMMHALDHGNGTPEGVRRTLQLAAQHGRAALARVVAQRGGAGRPPSCEDLALCLRDANPLLTLAAIPPLYEDFIPLLFEANLIDWLRRIHDARPDAVPTAMAFLAEVDDEWYGLPPYNRATWAEAIQVENQVLAERLVMWTIQVAKAGTCHWDDLVYLLEDILRFIAPGRGNRARQAFLLSRFALLEEILAAAVRVVERSRRQDGWPVVDVFSWRTSLLEIAFHWQQQNFTDVDAMISRLQAVCDLQDHRLLEQNASEPQPYFPTGVDVELSVLLSGGSFERLQPCLANRPQQTYPYPANPANAWRFLDKHPSVQRFLSRTSERPELIVRIKLILQRLALALRLQSTYALRNDLTRWEEVGPVGSEFLPPGVPAVASAELQLLLAWLRHTHGSLQLPRSVEKILDRPRQLQEELQRLQERSAGEPLAAAIVGRLANVKRYLDDESALHEWISRDLTHELEKQVPLLRLAALEQLVARAIERHWQLLNPDINIHDDVNWDNALLLGMTITHNRRLLKELLRMTAAGKPDWFRRHPVNRRFLDTVASHGVNAVAWAGSWQQKYRVDEETWTVYLENDPLRVLQMGNLFDTCLSVGGEMSYACVANAIEANKRVIYVHDAADHIVGRKLIVMNRHGRLFGFNSYGAGMRTKLLLDQFCCEFAAHCGAALAREEDSIGLDSDDLRLFADWYFDGIEPFDWWVLAGMSMEELEQDLLRNFPKRWHHDEIAVLRGLLRLGAAGIRVLAKHRRKLPKHSLRRLRRETNDPALRQYLDPLCQ